MDDANKLLEQKEFSRSLVLYDKCLSYDHNSLEAHIGKVICYFNLSRFEDAYMLAQALLKKFGEHEILYIWMIKILISKKDNDRLELYFNKYYDLKLNAQLYSAEFYAICIDLLEYIFDNNILLKIQNDIIKCLVYQEKQVNYDNILTALSNYLFQTHELDKSKFERVHDFLNKEIIELNLDPMYNVNSAMLFLAFNFECNVSRRMLLSTFFAEFNIFTHWSFILIATAWNAIWNKNIYSNDNIIISSELLKLNVKKSNLNEDILFQYFVLSYILNDLESRNMILEKINTLDNLKYKNDWQYIIDHNISMKDKVKTTKKQLKIALCVSGQLRGYKEAFQSWQNLGIYEHEVTTFVHTWNDIGSSVPIPPKDERCFTPSVFKIYRKIWNIYGEDTMKKKYSNLFELFNANSLANIDNLKQLYKTDHVIIENSSDDNFKNFTNAEKMYYKIEKCHEMVESANVDFDLVIRIRPDFMVNKNVRIDLYDLLSKTLKNNTIYTTTFKGTDNGFYTFPGVGLCMDDTFAVGVPSLMGLYSKAYSMSQKHNFNYFPSHFIAHSNLAFTCIYNNLGVKTVHLCEGLNNHEKPSNVELKRALLKDLSIEMQSNEPDKELIEIIDAEIIKEEGK